MNSNTQFPNLSFSSSLDTDPVFLDGQKVLFDKKVALTPVQVEPVSKSSLKANSKIYNHGK